MREILIAGGGPAGAAAAIAARREGAAVRLLERATGCRHKVCGEFLSPAVARILDELGLGSEFAELGPSQIRSCALHLGRYVCRWKLAESGWGLSRLALDRMLMEHAARVGATISRGEAYDLRAPQSTEGTLVVACGRQRRPPPGDRLFGFKSHFEGPGNDAVELFFDRDGYAGVSAIEGGLTNVCGIASESVLRRFGFDFDAVVARSRPLAERVAPLRRKMEWLVTGPVAFVPPAAEKPAARYYAAGDSLGFVDPFTGTGILNALLTGSAAGTAAARGEAVEAHLRRCAALLSRPFRISSLLRRLTAREELHWVAPWIPGQMLFRLTRARV